MTRNIRKVVSIVCAVAVLLSLCVVSMVGTTSAFKATDTPVGGTLKLDFENKTGISDGYTKVASNLYVADPADANNTVVKISGNATSNVEIGKADADTLDGSEAFVLQPKTEYVLTFKYKFGAGSYGCNADDVTPNQLAMTLYFGSQSAYSPSASKVEAKREVYNIDPAVNTETTTVGSGNVANNILKNDTDWMTFTFRFTTGDSVDGKDNLYINVPVRPNTQPYSFVTAYIDDVTIDIVDELEDLNNEYVFNFKQDATNTYWAPNSHNLMANSNSTSSKVDAAGAHLTVTNSNTAGTHSTWRQKVYVYDQDNGGYFQIKQDATYLVTLKYKVETVNSANATIGIGHTAAGDGTDPTRAPSASYGHVFAFFNNAWATHSAADMSTTRTITTTFEGNDANKNTWLAIIAHGDSGAANTFLIESVTVKEIRNSNGVAVVTFDSVGGKAVDADIYVAGTNSNQLPAATHTDSTKGFAGWYYDSAFKNPVGATLKAGAYTLYARWSSDVVTITFNNSGTVYTGNFAKNTPLARPDRPDSTMFFEGWYTDINFTNKVTAAPDFDCTLYAKYNYTYIQFNNGGMSDASYDLTGIVADPDDSDNKVLNLHTAAGSAQNFEIGMYDVAGAPAYRMPLVNSTYYIQFKYKVPAGNPGGRVMIYTGGQSRYNEDMSKNTIDGMTFTWDAESGANGTDWVTVSGYYTVGSNFYRERVNFTVQDKFYITIGSNGADGSANKEACNIYIDDIIVGVYSEEVPAGAVGIFFETNGENIAPLFGYTGDEVMMPEDPYLAGYKFIGWYTDMNFQNKFKSTTFGSETVTLYAKWELIDAIFDFETYNHIDTTSGRYNLVAEANGNHYIRYNYEQGLATSTAGPSNIARIIINNGGVRYTVMEGASYTISFRYLVEETTGSITFAAVTHQPNHTWTDSNELAGHLTVTDVTDGWTEGSFKVTARCLVPSANCLSLGIGGDATVYVDDIKIECSTNIANVYGSTSIVFNTNSDIEINPFNGNPGDAIVLPKPTRSGYKFGGWYADAGLTEKFTDKVYGDEDIVLYAKWLLGKFAESYENFPSYSESGISSAYMLYNGTTVGEAYDKNNVYAGSTSIFRDGTAAGIKAFTLCRESDLALTIGEQYTLTFYVKPENVTNAAGVINLIQMSYSTGVGAPSSTGFITDIGSLTAGKWQKVSYTFTATDEYVGISTSEGNDIYFDDFTVALKGYTGTTTGDSSVSPIIIMLMVVLAAGAMIVTGKKVFAK